MVYVFFFQAEDGIRDADVTGVQTCALPIFGKPTKDSSLWHCMYSGYHTYWFTSHDSLYRFLRFSYLAAAFPASMLLTNITSFYNASTFEIINSELRTDGHHPARPDRKARVRVLPRGPPRGDLKASQALALKRKQHC